MRATVAKETKGSALLVTAVLVVIIGLAGLGFLYSLKPVTRETQEEKTIDRMHHVIHVLSVYMQRYSRLPCPADPDSGASSPPFGAERGSGASGTGLGSCSASTSLGDGIVPFRTLGLSEDDIRDGWGHYFTYHINQSSSFSASDAAAYVAANPNVKVHDLCRVKDVWVDRGGLADNWYPQYALACCQQPGAGQITVVDGSGADVSGNTATWSPPDYQPQHSPAPPPSIHDYTLPVQPAMVLISHGKNGLGAYLGSGTHARMATAGASAGEVANAAGDTGNISFVMMPRTESSAYYFDDLVIFETLATLYEDVGNNTGGFSCSFAPGCPPVPVSAATTNAWSPSPMQDVYGNNCR